MKVYFKNLDGIRFFAAFLVLLQHSFGFKRAYSPTDPFIDRMFSHTGVLGVNLFFILSGFLISYLLLIEKERTGTISYKKFYMRRILRIWPLYLGYGIFLAFFSPYISEMLGLGNDTNWSITLINLIFLFLFSVNIQLAFMGANKGIFEISWSVCIEEQFYLVWPVIINKFRLHLKKLLIVLFVISIISRLFFCVYLPYKYDSWPYDLAWSTNYLLIFDKLDLFGGGLILAVLFHHREKYKLILKKCFQPWIQVVVISLAILYTFSLIRPGNEMVVLFSEHYICLILYGYTLLSAVMENSILRLENPLLRTLGRISFGIYLFHTAICQVVLAGFKKFIGQPDSHLVYDIFYPLVCLVITCTVSYFSYEFYEKRFLRLKSRYSVITTRI